MYRRSDMPPSSPANENIHPSTVPQIFRDYCLRRLGFLRAFSIDFDSFDSACDSEMEILCVYAYPNGSWDVIPQAVNLLPGLPEPSPGINKSLRQEVSRRNWLSLVACVSDYWLLSLAKFFNAHLTPDERNLLLDRIKGFQSLFQQVKLLGSHALILEARPETVQSELN